MSQEIIIVGGGGTCADVLVLIEAINQERLQYRVVGILDDSVAPGELLHGFPVLGGIQDGPRLFSQYGFVNCLGSSRSYAGRKAFLQAAGYEESNFVSIVHPTACIAASSLIAPGCIIFPYVVVLSGVEVGACTQLLSHTVINHDCKIGGWSIVASQVSLSGAVTLGQSVYVGTGSKLKEGISVGNRSLIGMGSIVLTDVDEGQVVVGNPAGVLRDI